MGSGRLAWKSVHGFDQVGEIFGGGGFGSPGFGHACIQQRAAFAARFPFCRRRDSGANDFVQARGSGDSLLAQVFVEEDFSPVLAFDVEDGTGGYGDAEHFFEAHGLSAELDFVVVPTSFFAAFEIDGVGDSERSSIVVAAEFNEVGFASNSQSIRHQHHPGYVPLVASFEVRGLIDLFVSVNAFGSVLIVLPDLFDQMQRQSPFAEQQVVQVTQRQEIIFQHGKGFPKS